MSRKDHTGLKYGMLTVISFSHTDGEGKSARAVWNCLCSCGRERKFRAEWLTRKVDPATHCGCSKTYKKRAIRPKAPYARAAYKIDGIGIVAEEMRIVREGEKTPPPGDWRQSLVIASRRSHAPWKDVAQLIEWTIEEAKALFESAA